MYASAVVVSYDYNADANDCIDVGLCIGLKVAYWLWLTGQPSKCRLTFAMTFANVA